MILIFFAQITVEGQENCHNDAETNICSPFISILIILEKSLFSYFSLNHPLFIQHKQRNCFLNSKFSIMYEIWEQRVYIVKWFLKMLVLPKNCPATGFTRSRQQSVRTHSNSRNPALPSDSKKTTFQRNWHKIGPKIAIAMIERQFWR